MGPLALFWRYSIDTYGGAPVLLLMNLMQLSLLGWVLLEVVRSRVEAATGSLEAAEHRVRAARRAELWQKQVRPISLTLMLLGPGLGLGMSTLLGALGMGALSDAMASQVSADTLAATMAHAYREISYAYFLMVGGTLPMLLGPVAVLLAKQLDEQGADAAGGEPEEVMLHTLKGLLAVAEAQAKRSQLDAARTHALLEQTTAALRRGVAA